MVFIYFLKMLKIVIVLVLVLEKFNWNWNCTWVLKMQILVLVLVLEFWKCKYLYLYLYLSFKNANTCTCTCTWTVLLELELYLKNILDPIPGRGQRFTSLSGISVYKSICVHNHYLFIVQESTLFSLFRSQVIGHFLGFFCVPEI